MSCCEKKLSFDLILFAIIIFALNNFQSFRSCLLVWVYLALLPLLPNSVKKKLACVKY